MPRTSAKNKQEQLEVPGTERKKIAAIEDAASALRTCRTERMELQEQEVGLQEALLAAMAEHDVTSYRFHLDDEELVATAESKRKVKIRKTTTPTLSIVAD